VIIVDMNAVSDFWRRVPQVMAHFDNPQTVFVPSVVIGELYYMALNSARKAENLERLDAFSSRYPILRPDADTEFLYGYVVYRLKQRSLIIPDHDAWIAAAALQFDLSVLSRDKHLTYVNEIKVISWPTPSM
jgi:tRNA(fMet)-specific endonuclease VapC